jgi:hypothetical protein
LALECLPQSFVDGFVRKEMAAQKERLMKG